MSGRAGLVVQHSGPGAHVFLLLWDRTQVLSFPFDWIEPLAHRDVIKERCMDCSECIFLGSHRCCGCPASSPRRLLLTGFFADLWANDPAMLEALTATNSDRVPSVLRGSDSDALGAPLDVALSSPSFATDGSDAASDSEGASAFDEDAASAGGLEVHSKESAAVPRGFWLFPIRGGRRRPDVR